MSDDFTTEVARRRLKQIDAQLMQHQANYASHEAEGEVEGAVWEADQISGLLAQRQNVLNAYNQHQQARNAVPPKMTEAEFQAMSPEQMARHPEAIEQVFAKSKYYSPQDAQDPEFQRRFYAGMEEVKRRRRVESGGR